MGSGRMAFTAEQHPSLPQAATNAHLLYRVYVSDRLIQTRLPDAFCGKGTNEHDHDVFYKGRDHAPVTRQLLPMATLVMRCRARTRSGTDSPLTKLTLIFNSLSRTERQFIKKLCFHRCYEKDTHAQPVHVQCILLQPTIGG